MVCTAEGCTAPASHRVTVYSRRGKPVVTTLCSFHAQDAANRLRARVVAIERAAAHGDGIRAAIERLKGGSQ